MSTPNSLHPSADSTTLDDLLRPGGLGSTALDLLRPAGIALDSHHARGVLVRNLHPATVHVTSSWDVELRPSPPSADPSGSASPAPLATGDSDSNDGLYEAPEQWESPGTASHRTDLWAFACVAFEAITGVAAFTLASLSDRPKDDPPKVSTHRPETPAAVNDVFAEAFARDPDDRPDSASEFISRLEASYAGQYQRRASVRLQLAMWIAVLVAAVAVVAAVVVVTLGS